MLVDNIAYACGVREMNRWNLLMPKIEVHTNNGLNPLVLSGRVSCSSSGDRKVPYLRKIVNGVDMAA